MPLSHSSLLTEIPGEPDSAKELVVTWCNRDGGAQLELPLIRTPPRPHGVSNARVVLAGAFCYLRRSSASPLALLPVAPRGLNKLSLCHRSAVSAIAAVGALS